MSELSITLKSTDYPQHLWDAFNKLDHDKWVDIINKGYNVVFDKQYNYAYDTIHAQFNAEKFAEKFGYLSESSDAPAETYVPPKAINQTVASADIGYIGEQYVENILSDHYGISNVTKTGHMGDLIITDPKVPELDIKMMIEIKNYTTKVPTKEMKKFYSDIKTNGAVSAGIFISLKSDITGIGSSFEFRNIWEDRNVPVIYLVSHEKDIILAAISILFDYVRLEKSKLINYDICLDQIENIWSEMKNLADLGNGLSKLRSSIHDIKDTMYRQLNLISDDSWKLENLLKQSLNKINDSTRLLNYQMTTDLDDITGDCELYNDVDNLVKCFENLVDSASLLNDKSFKNLITSFIREIMGTLSDKFGAYLDKKDIVIIHGENSNSKRLITISQLKTKITFSMNISGKKIVIPESAEYKKGWVVFSITKFTMRNAIDRDIYDVIQAI